MMDGFKVERVLIDEFRQLVPPHVKRILLTHPAFPDLNVEAILPEEMPDEMRGAAAKMLASALGRAVADIIVERIADKITAAEDETIGHVYARQAQQAAEAR